MGKLHVQRAKKPTVRLFGVGYDWHVFAGFELVGTFPTWRLAYGYAFLVKTLEAGYTVRSKRTTRRDQP